MSACVQENVELEQLPDESDAALRARCLAIAAHVFVPPLDAVAAAIAFETHWIVGHALVVANPKRGSFLLVVTTRDGGRVRSETVAGIAMQLVQEMPVWLCTTVETGARAAPGSRWQAVIDAIPEALRRWRHWRARSRLNDPPCEAHAIPGYCTKCAKARREQEARR